MEIRKISISKNIQNQNEVLIQETPVLHRIKNVLRLKDNDPIILIDGSGYEYLGQIKIKEGNLYVEIKRKRKIKNLISKNINLYIGFLKKKVLEELIEKLAQIGVRKITPIKTERTNWFCNEIPERWQKIVRKANEVSTWQNFTELGKPLTFIEAISIAKNQNIFLLDPSGEITLRKFKKLTKKIKNINIFIGPEGGFSEKEIKLAKQNSAKTVKIPKNYFRSEIAALICSIVILYD